MNINVVGKITCGPMIDWFIIIKDDTANTGGYLVLQSPNPDFNGDGYDNWFGNLNEVDQYFRFNDLSIEWFS